MKEYLTEFRNKFNYHAEMMPVVMKIAHYEYGVIVKVNRNYHDFEIDFDIPVPEMINLIRDTLKPYFPRFEHTEVLYRNLTLQEIEEIRARKEDVDINDLIEKKQAVEVKTQYVIEKIYTRDKHLILVEDEIPHRYKYKGDDSLKDAILHSENLYDFIFGQCWMVEDVHSDFPINIRYSGKQMLSFFILNKDYIENEPVYLESEGYYTWGRYHIYFESDELRNLCLSYLKEH
jgi:hypothetical protein